MNIKNLSDYIEENGNEFKNYRHLCKVLDEKVKGGNAKKAQIKEIERYTKLSKGKGYRLIVEEIYDTPEVETGNNVYGGLIQLLLTDYFMKTKKTQIAHSAGYLMQQADMINENYRYNKKNIGEYSEKIKIDKTIIHDFYDTTDATLKSAIETALKNLENRALILFTEEHLVKPVDSNQIRAATPSEKGVILYTRDKLLKELGYKTVRDVLFSADQNTYKNKMNTILQEEIEIEKTFKGYNITILQESIAQKQAEMIIDYLSDTESKNYKDKLNNLVVSRLLNNAINRQNKVNEIEPTPPAFGEAKIKLNDKQLARKSDGYVEGIEKVIYQNVDNNFMDKETKRLTMLVGGGIKDEILN